MSVLSDFIVRAGLVQMLSGPGPFTLFAPTNTAFGALPDDFVDTLSTNDEFIPHLRNLLLYHVFSGSFISSNVEDGSQITSLNGETALINVSPFTVNGVSVTNPDNVVANGIVHIIENVLIPSWVANSITDRVVQDIDLSTLRALVVFADLADTLAAPGEFTLVAPTNDAFAKLSAADVNFLTSDEGKETLVQILLYHVFPGVFVLGELSDGSSVDTLQGGTVQVSAGEDGVFFNNAQAVSVDILANNGVVLKIDTVLDPADGRTIFDFVVGRPELTALTTAVVRAGLVDTLKSEGPFTMFAPNNDAFGALPADILDTLLTNDEFIPHLVNLLAYHVLLGESLAADLAELANVTGANGEDLFVTLPPIAVNGNEIEGADNNVKNGVVHILGGVLLPSWVTNSIAGRVVGAGDLSTLLAFVVLAGLDGAVAAPGELTLVAPTNDAFAKLPTEVVDFLTSEAAKETLTAILLYHVFFGILVSSELSDGLTIDTLHGGTVEVSVGKDGVFFNDAKAVEVDILANNGVVHKIDTVLDPLLDPALNQSIAPSQAPTSAPSQAPISTSSSTPSAPSQTPSSPPSAAPTSTPADVQTIVDFVVGNADLTALATAVVRADLVNALNSQGPFTLFAPNDGAFGALPSDILETLLTNDEFIPHLVNLLAYHVLVGEAFSADLSDGLTVTAGNGQHLLITLSPMAVNGNEVVSGDNVVSNGVVHIVDGVLIPSWAANSITDRVAGTSDLSTLLALVVSAELGDTLAAPGELTLVAPTNEAFAKLPSEVMELLTSDAGKETLINILLYHVFPGIFVSSELSDGTALTTVQGGTVEVSVSEEGVFFNDAKAVQVDTLASNGVVHKIDTVLDPADGAAVGLPEEGTVVDFVVGNTDLTALTTAVVRAGLVDTLNEPGMFTLFAPSNDAFAAVPEELLNTLLTNDEFIPHLTDLLLYHVLDDELFSLHFFNFRTLALNGEFLLIMPTGINENKAVDTDNDVSNGVVHILDGVLIPSWVTSSIASRVVAASDLSTLLTLVVLAGLDGSVAAPGELTLVAPTNAAFAKLPAATVEFLTSDTGKETLTSILLYHVFPGIFVSSDLSDGITVDTLQGGTVEVAVGGEGVFFNDAKAVEVNILSNNGVIHKIDTVLDPAGGTDEGLPQSEPPMPVPVDPKDGTIFDYITGNPDLSYLAVAVLRAGLDGALDSIDAYTLFAPNNAAFAAVPRDTLDTIWENDEFIPHLKDLLLYHVLGNEIFTNTMYDGIILNALNGEKLTVTRPQLEVSGSRVVQRNIDVSNGVVNVVKDVLIPSWVTSSVADRVISASDLSTLLSLMVLSDLDGVLTAPGALTVVAPSNDAFAELPAGSLPINEGNDTLREIILYHVFPGIFVSSELSDGVTVQAVMGGIVRVSVIDERVFFNSAKAVEVDILANNGVVHIIDAVLDPTDGQ
jgi:transforming growth factor-beta-induced protein